MAGTGDFFADEYAQLQQEKMPHHYGAPKAKAQSNCFPPSPCQSTQSAHAVSPDAHAYGSSLRGNGGAHGNHGVHGQGGYVPSTYGAAHRGLRGGHAPFKAHTYGTLGVTNYEAGEDLYGVQGRFGYQLNKYFGAEVEGSLGLSKDSTDLVVGGAPFEQTIGVENSVAGFGVLRYPLFGKISGYSRVGYHRTELDEKVSDATSVITDREYSTDGLAYGSGLEYSLNPRTAVRLDYTVYDYNGPDSDAVSLAISRKF